MKTEVYFAPATDTEITLVYPSEVARDAAMDWYNSPRRSKKEIVAYCAERGFPLSSATKGQLLADWADVAMMIKAWEDVGGLPEARDMLAGLIEQVREAGAELD